MFASESRRAAPIHWLADVGGDWSDPSKWDGNHVPPPGASPYIYRGGGFSTSCDVETTWDSVRADGSLSTVTVHFAADKSLTANELAVGIFADNIGEGAIWRMAAGTLNAGAAYAGASGIGTIDQTGGRLVVGQFLSIGENEGVRGRYQIGGGMLQAGQINVGYRGTGTLNFFGGSALVSGYYSVGHLETGVGTVEMIAGGVTAGAGYVGLGGAGTFTQYGGTHTLIDWLDLAEGEGATGRYDMQGGTLVSGELAVGLNGGVGSFTQTGGIVSAGYFYVGPGSAASIGSGSFSAATIEFDGTCDINAGSFALTADVQDALRIECGEGDLRSVYGVGYDQAHAIATVPGDVNLDRVVNISDYSMIGANFNMPGYWTAGDVNYDGTVGIADFSVVAAHWNESFSARVPDAAVQMLAVMPLLIGRRRI